MWSHLASDTSYDELHAFAARRSASPSAASTATTTTCRPSGTTRSSPLGVEAVSSRELIRRLHAAGLRRRKRPRRIVR